MENLPRKIYNINKKSQHPGDLEDPLKRDTNRSENPLGNMPYEIQITPYIPNVQSHDDSNYMA